MEEASLTQRRVPTESENRATAGRVKAKIKMKKAKTTPLFLYAGASLFFCIICFFTVDLSELDGSIPQQPIQPLVRKASPAANRSGATVELVKLQKARKEGDGPDKTMGYKIIQTLPHDSNAFSQGFEFLAGKFIESTGIKSSLREVDIQSGSVLKIHLLAQEHFGEGVTVFKGKIYQLTWRSKVCLVYDLETWEELNRFSYDTQGWGITHDHSHLIMSDGSHKLVFRDPKTFEITRQVQVKDPAHNNQDVRLLNELEYVHGEVLANVWFVDKIARIDPKTGLVLGWIDLQGLHPYRSATARGEDVLNGIAYDADRDRLWVTGKLWPSVFEIELTASAPPQAASGSEPTPRGPSHPGPAGSPVPLPVPPPAA